ncbi:Protein OSB1, mitochondrial [Morella rubra]|uniref:Protein OSB1, mitochondrial n=1 Tax=Morella rubra TaxID=262757 RepID=A0A6A1W574_9ROSI|nr:Protein OSB1, mitochondrial [Morella rubra]
MPLSEKLHKAQKFLQKVVMRRFFDKRLRLCTKAHILKLEFPVADSGMEPESKLVLEPEWAIPVPALTSNFSSEYHRNIQNFPTPIGLMNAYRFGDLIKKATRFSQQRLASTAASPISPLNYFTDNDEGGSAVYRHALKFQRPGTIKLEMQLVNTVSFIGNVDYPLKFINGRNSGRLGVHTMLSVKPSPDSSRRFRILLNMWDRMAEMSLEHLKSDDFVYVSGRLGSFTKPREDAKLRTYYKVTVEELNYVSKGSRGSTSQGQKLQSEAGGTALEKYKDHLHLWQVFFSNPYEWWDYRRRKKTEKHPDFKHKDTGEALWLNPNDPPWIKRQLQILDTKMAEQGQRDPVGSSSRVSTWIYDD